MSEIFVGDYISEAKKALKNEVLQVALADLHNRFGRGTARAYKNLPEGPELRFKAHDIRMQAIENLDVLLETLAENVRRNDGHVFFAEDANAAV
ncbi:MAG: iron-sulfur cluster-binding protein, partial [Desulfobacterales bacterium]